MKVCLTATFANKKSSLDPTALYKLSYGLYLLTVNGEKPNGCISNSVFQISENPTRIAVSVQKGNFTREIIEETEELNVSVLSQDVPFSLIKHFGMQSGKEVDKFEDFKDTNIAQNGILYLNKFANAFLSLKVNSKTDLDSHILFICDITESQNLSSTPSCTYAHYHKAIKPKF